MTESYYPKRPDQMGHTATVETLAREVMRWKDRATLAENQVERLKRRICSMCNPEREAKP